MSFDWQTEDRHWDEHSDEQEPPRRRANRWALDAPPAVDPFETLEPDAPLAPPRPRRRWPFVAVAGVLLVALLGVLYWQLDRRSTAAQARLTTDIAASHTTLLDAAQQGDIEVFVGLLSGRDPNWTNAQERLLRGGGFVDRTPFDMIWTPAAPVSPTITLAPDLRAAELTMPQAYTVAIGNGLTETVVLQQTAIYRQGPDRWLYAPPDPDFWGATESIESRYARVSYPARDADIAAPLARDVDAALAELCRLAGDGCGDTLFIDLTLSTDPQAQAAYTRPVHTWSGGSTIVMPTPSLFGRPVDDAGYRALSRAYTSRVVSAAAANLSGWVCCDNVVFYGALREALLSRLGLRPRPVGAADYGLLTRRPDSLTVVEGVWGYNEAPAEARRTVATVVDFLANHSDMSIVEMQRRLLARPVESYWGWVAGVTGGAYGSQADFEYALLRYAEERGAEGTLH